MDKANVKVFADLRRENGLQNENNYKNVKEKCYINEIFRRGTFLVFAQHYVEKMSC